MSIRITSNAREVSRQLSRVPNSVDTAISEHMIKRVGPRILRHLQVEHLSGGSLGVQTGNTRRATFQRSAGPKTIEVGVDVNKAPGARLHEYGGTIRAKKGKMAVPLDAVKTGSGVKRFNAKDVQRSPGSFGYVGTFVVRDVIFGDKGAGGIVPLFVLKDSVTMKPVGYLASTATEMTPWVRDSLADVVFEAVSSG